MTKTYVIIFVFFDSNLNFTETTRKKWYYQWLLQHAKYHYPALRRIHHFIVNDKMPYSYMSRGLILK